MNYEANIQRFCMDRKGNIDFIFFRSSEALLNHNQIAKQWLSVELFAKMLLELNAQHVTKDYIMLASGKKRHNLQRISSKCQRFTWVISRSSRREGFFKRDVLEDFAKFTGDPLNWSLFLIKLQSSILQLYFKKRPQQHRCFPIKFCGIFKNTSGQLLDFSLFQERFLIIHLFL